VTGWRSREELEQYLSRVDRRRGFALTLLEGAGGKPVVDVLELVMDSNTTWWP
jgi:hypothetical protein